MINVRQRRTQRLTRARIRLLARRSVIPFGIALLGLGLSGASVLYIISNVAKTTYAPVREVRFEVADARGVVGGSRQELRFRGVPAGSITDVELVRGRAVVTAKLFKEFGQLYRNARAELRPNTALEDMFIDVLDRGTPSAGPLGDDVLPARSTPASVQPEEVLEAFDEETRGKLSVLLDQLGKGLDDRGASLRLSLARLVPFLDQAKRLTDQLAERGELTRSLVSKTAVLTQELGRRDRDLRALVVDAGITLRTTQAGERDLDATLSALPVTLESLDDALAVTGQVLPSVNTALTDLRPAAKRLPAALSTLSTFAGQARPAVQALQRPVKRLRPLSRALPATARSLRSAVTALRSQLPALDRALQTIAGCPAALQGFFQWTPSVTKWGDARGPAVRGSFAFGADSLQNAKDPSVVKPESCAPGRPIGGEPGTGGDLKGDD